jgi:hypothetical protein
MLFLTALTATAALVALALAVQPTQSESEDAMAEMMKAAARWTQPGEHHKELERFVGKWDTETRMFMGGKATPGEKGTAEFTWLMPGRWLQYRAQGSMMGMQAESACLMGYDNFKMSYVATGVSSFDTAMNRFEGDMTPDGKSLVMYGTLDEYLTGEHDKMVKYAWRFLSPDKMLFEIHDLPIGETNTKVVEITYTRAK